MAARTQLNIEDVLTERQLSLVVKKCVGAKTSWQLVKSELKPATEGIAGFLGDHLRLSLKVKVEDRLVEIPLFVKRVPVNNQPKAEYIDKKNFFRREKVMFKLMEDLEIEGPSPWGTPALLYSNTVLVMRDLAPEGYSTINQLQTFDLPHSRVALSSIARFHAATANYETRKKVALGRPYFLTEEFGEAIKEANYSDTPWMRAGAKLIADFIQHFSDKYRNTIPDLEAKVIEQCLKACADLAETKDSLNVAVHKDLWGNNIMFKHENDVPTNAILVDYQCVGYAPPSFDVMLFWYVTTLKSFRIENEDSVLRYYFVVFMDSVDENTKLRLHGLGYDFEEFLRWVEKSRRFGLFATLILYPYVLMDQENAQAIFDDPETFEERFNKDRSEPVLAYAQRCPLYLRRMLEVSEEFVERYLET